MVSKDHKLSMRRQSALLTLTRSNLYYEPKGESAENLQFMAIIDKDLCTIGNSLTLPNLYLLEDHIGDFMDIFSYDSARRIGDQNVLRKVDALMDWSAISVLLKNGLKRSGLGPQGCKEITLFKCLLIGQWHNFSDPNSMYAAFCVEALKEALVKYGTPDIFTTDQGSQFTSGDWINVLTNAKIKISMDGKGAWRNNRMLERLWRSLKHECVYLHAFETGSEIRVGINNWLTYYNAERPHLTRGILTPDEAYANKTEPIRLAAQMKT